MSREAAPGVAGKVPAFEAGEVTLRFSDRGEVIRGEETGDVSEGTRPCNREEYLLDRNLTWCANF